MSNLPKIDPMKLSLRAQPFDNPDYIFELKHDGFRSLAYIADGRCELVSRQKNFYKRFGSLSEAMAGLKVKSAILDGEIVCLDSEGRSVFYELLFKRGEPIFYAFDLLWLNGEDLRQLPLTERKQKLRQLTRTARKSRVLYADHIEGRGVNFFRSVREQNLEGIVAKRKDSVYSSAGYWLPQAHFPETSTRSIRSWFAWYLAAPERTPTYLIR